MTQRGGGCGWSLGLFLVGVLGFLAACGNPGGEGCGGIEDLVSCVSVSSIEPTSTAGGASSNVDAFFSTADCNGDGVPDDAEPFTDHNADITFANTTFLGASDSLPVTLRRLTISYSLNNCPTGAVCPPLPTVTETTSLVILPEGTATATFPFVPLSVKQAYRTQGGSTFPPPSYNANYTFVAQTQNFADTFTIEASEGFTIGDFDLCP
jgi:hypothetical protein